MELEKLIVPLIANLDEWSKNLKQAEKEAGETATNSESKLSKFNKSVVAAGAVGFSALAAGATIALNAASDWGGELDSIQDHMANTNEEAAGLALLFKTVGGDTSQLTSAMDKLTNGLTSSTGAIGPSGLALQNLGINLQNVNGETKSSTQLFQEISDKLALMPEGIEKNSVLMDLFGKSGVELGDALTAASNGGLQSFTDKATAMGLAIDPQKAIDFQMASAQFDATLQGASVTIGSALLPVITPLIGKLSEMAVTWLPKITNFVSQNMTPILGVLAAAFLLWGINAAIAAVGTIAALSPVILIIGAIMLVAGLLFAAWSTNFLGIRDITDRVFTAVKKFIQDGIDRWNALVGAIRQGADWISTAISNVVKWVSDLIDKFKNIKIPDWLKPGSPPPLAYALMDINDQLKIAAKNTLPNFNAQINASVSNGNADVVGAIKGIPQVPEIDYQKLGRVLRDTMLQVGG